MFKKTYSYLTIATLFTAVLSFTACSNNDDTLPKEKTADEVAIENLAEFQKIIGNGVSNTTYEKGLAFKKISELTPDEMDKVTFENVSDEEFFFKFKNKEFYYSEDNGDYSVKGNVFSLDKKDGVFTLISKQKDKKTIIIGGKVSIADELLLHISYDTKTSIITFLQEGYTKGVFVDIIMISKYKAKPMAPTSKKQQTKTFSKSLQKKNIKTLAGIHYVDVELKGESFAAKAAASLLQPKGFHYVKLTTKVSGETQLQFCDAAGNTSTTDYNYNTTKHFWANKMPMALNLDEVAFTYNNELGTISQGTAVMVRARKNYNPSGIVPPLFGSVLTNQDSGSAATIISTNGNSAGAFTIKIKLDFMVDFNCVISK